MGPARIPFSWQNWPRNDAWSYVLFYVLLTQHRVSNSDWNCWTQHCNELIRRRKINYNRGWIKALILWRAKNRLLLITSLGRGFVQNSKCKMLNRGTDAKRTRDQIYRNNFLPVLVCPSLNLEIRVHFLLSCSYEVCKVSIVKLEKAWDWAWRQFSVCQKIENKIKWSISIIS